MISFQKATKIYPANAGRKEIVALKNISFTVKKGEFLTIIGTSGSGKTTLLKLILAEEKPTKGRVFFDSQDVHKIKRGKLHHLRRKIGAIFQDYKLLPFKTVYENVAYALEVIGATEDEIEKDVPRILEIVGLSERTQNFPRELSAGECQRTAIARALIHRPEIILADEPTGNLDPYNTLGIIDLLLKINSLGTTIILATHNKEVVQSLKKRVMVLKDGILIRDEEGGQFIL